MNLRSPKCILGFIPLHDMVELQTLEKSWIKFFEWPWKQNVVAVKDYFGEKIGLYFVWLGFYTSALVPSAFLGLLSWIWIAVESAFRLMPFTLL